MPAAACHAPSRGRDPTSLATRAAAGDQPAGRAFPSLFPPGIQSPQEHVDHAASIDVLKFFLKSAVPPKETSVLRLQASNPRLLVAQRRSATQALQELARRLSPAAERWRKALPPGSPASSINLALLHLLAHAMEHPDRDIAGAMSRGMELTGHDPPCGSLAPRQSAARTSAASLATGLKERNASIVASLERQSPDDQQACWSETLADAERGWVSTPRPLTKADLQNRILSPRFVIYQKGKCRVIDDLKRSGVNDTLALSDTSIPDTLDRAYAASKLLDEQGAGGDLLLYSVDFESAYKHVGVSPESSGVATLVFWNPLEGAAYTSSLLTQPFGPRRSPSNWARVTSFLKAALLSFFGVVLNVFVPYYCSQVDGSVMIFPFEL